MQLGQLQFGDRFVIKGSSESSPKMVVRRDHRLPPSPKTVAAVSLLTGHLYELQSNLEVLRVLAIGEPSK